jgi:hypothetical protein
MALYRRCPDAKDDVCGKLARSKKGGIAEETEHNTYETCDKPKGCTKTGDTDCKCFVVAMHVNLKDDDSKEEITEEVTYPGSRIHNKNEEELLNVEKRKAEHPGKGPGHEKSFWKVECRCLAVDKNGKPIEL